MSLQLSQILSLQRKLSKTDETETPYFSADSLQPAVSKPWIMAVLREVTNQVEKNAALHAGMQCVVVAQPLDTIVKEIVVYTLDLLEVPEDLQGVLLGKECVNYLVDSAFKETKNGDLSHQDLADVIAAEPFIKAVIDIWYTILKDHVYVTGIGGLETKPRIEKSPMMTFHLTAYHESSIYFSNIREGRYYKVKGVFAPHLYQAIGYDLHKKLKARLKKYKKDETKQRVARVARFLFELASDVIRTSPDLDKLDFDTICDELKKDMRANYGKFGRTRLHRPEDTVEEIIADFEHLLDDKKKIITKTVKVRKKRPQGDLPDEADVPDGGESDFKKAGKMIKEIGLSSDDEDSLPGESPADLIGGYAKESDDSKSGRTTGHLNSQYVPHHSERGYMQLPMYIYVYEYLYEKADGEHSHQERLMLLYLLILINTGTNVHALARARVVVDAEELPAGEIGLLKIQEQYYLLVPSQVEHSGEQFGVCKKTSRNIHVPIPPEIAQYIPEAPADGKYLFSLFDGGEAAHKQNFLQEVKDFIKEINARYSLSGEVPDQYRHAINLTVCNLSYSFFSLYSELCGLNELLACHVSGKDHRGIYGAQLYYLYVPHERLAREYLAAFREAQYQIGRALHQAVKEKRIQLQSAVMPERNETEITVNESLPGYGSVVFADTEYFRARITLLKDELLKEKDFAKRHNLFTMYTYLAVQFATMLRPHRDPQLFWYHLILSRMIVIADKDSARRREERVVPLPETVWFLLTSLRDEWRKVRNAHHREINPSGQKRYDERMFFLIEGQKLVPFKFDAIVEFFKSIGSDFDVPANAARHYTSTRMSEKGLDNVTRAVWKGQTRTGREIFGVASTMNLHELAKIVIPVIDEILSEINLTKMEYYHE